MWELEGLKQISLENLSIVSKWGEFITKTQDSGGMGASIKILEWGVPSVSSDFAHHHICDFEKVT